MLIACMYGIVYYDYRTGRIADAGYDFGGYQNNVTINNATLTTKATSISAPLNMVFS